MPRNNSGSGKRTLRDLPRRYGGTIFIRDVESTWYRYDSETGRTLTGTTGVSIRPGNRWSYGKWSDCEPREATHVILPWSSYSDYSGSGSDRSNHRSLLRDFPRSVITVGGGYGTQALMASVKSRNEALIDAVFNLCDYPLYNEDDYSALEFEETEAAWDDYLRADTRRDLTGLAGKECDAAEWAEDVLDDSLSEEQFREWYYESLQDQNEDPYLETATSLVFPHHKDSVRFVWRKIIEWALEPYRVPPGQPVLL